MQYFTDLFGVVAAFVEQGGPVLYLIGGLLVLMWALIFERAFYFNLGLKKDVKAVVNEWQLRRERHSWNARRIREALISETTLKITQNMGLIKTLVAMAPMLGLLGTVTGMITVFHIMAVTGGGDPKLMAGGVSQATIPTMAGMVAALSGVFAQAALTRIVERESALLEDHLTYDHDDE